MKILALETSTEYCSVALWQDGTISELCELVGQNHSQLLMKMLDILLNEAGVKIKQVDAIGFGKGPGSFTGVRISCGVTQGLALGANVKVIGVCTLLAMAQASGHDKVISAMDARMGELYLAAYEKCNDEWMMVIEPNLFKPSEVLKVGGPLSTRVDTILAPPEVSGEDWFGVGSGFRVGGSSLAEHYSKHLLNVDALAMPRASAVAQIAAIEFAKGHAVNAALALPLYLRNKVALKTKEREDALIIGKMIGKKVD